MIDAMGGTWDEPWRVDRDRSAGDARGCRAGQQRNDLWRLQRTDGIHEGTEIRLWPKSHSTVLSLWAGDAHTGPGSRHEDHWSCSASGRGSGLPGNTATGKGRLGFQRVASCLSNRRPWVLRSRRDKCQALQVQAEPEKAWSRAPGPARRPPGCRASNLNQSLLVPCALKGPATRR